ncbi:NAD(P)-dependent oxidoreductase [Lederbergia ruris]|uniref:dTDP-4-dehydrorhamnose reductase n=1 Tax=Lederbergia ruris TaxID=217495 RepID=A0ABQ4KQL3_9BACI|nr:dTDP-4-dehydrorhamnose reductase [Lederbergia ruris]GIN59424.1 NAD(P)-dependent oxidoreductase [Lederbergia ruris]
MKILVTGYGGQLGFDVVKEGNQRKLEVIGTTSSDLNITDETKVREYINRIKPEAIIHCAAYTAVDNAEDDRDKCYDVNANGTKYLATMAKEIDAKFVYISTDYVYNGKGEIPFSEESTPDPIGYYGKTKYKGEQIVQSLLDNYFIVRISWVFGTNGNNFVKTMLRLAETHNELNVVGDQFGSPTYTFDLARLIIDMVQSEKYGIYHASNEGYCSWAEFATEIFRHANKNVKVNSITTEDYPTRAVRPKNSRMSKRKLVDNGFKPLPTWQDAVARYLKYELHEVK